jgi:hypothetical protein
MAILAIVIPIVFVVGLFALLSFIGWVEVDEPGLIRGTVLTRKQRPPARAAVRPSSPAVELAQPATR